MDEDVFLRDFFRLRDESLLQALNLLDQLVRLDVRRLELSPPVDVEGLLELVGEELGLLLLLEQFLLKEVNLAFQVRDALRLLLGVDELPLAVFDLVLEVPNVFHLLLVVNLTFFERRFLNFDLFIEQV